MIPHRQRCPWLDGINQTTCLWVFCVCACAQAYLHVCMYVQRESLNVCVWARAAACVCVRESQEESEIVCGWDTFWQSSPFFRNNHLFPLQRQSRVTLGLLKRHRQTKTLCLSLSPCVCLSLSLWLPVHQTLVLVAANEGVWLSLEALGLNYHIN